MAIKIITDAKTQYPVPDAKISLPQKHLSTKTDKEGKFYLDAQLDGATIMNIEKNGYKFNIVDKMLTNFHLPKSTLIMLVSAFAGKDFVFDAYNQAVAEKYRFFSYGDCMLIE